MNSSPTVGSGTARTLKLDRGPAAGLTGERVRVEATPPQATPEDPKLAA